MYKIHTVLKTYFGPRKEARKGAQNKELEVNVFQLERIAYKTI